MAWLILMAWLSLVVSGRVQIERIEVEFKLHVLNNLGAYWIKLEYRNVTENGVSY